MALTRRALAVGAGALAGTTGSGLGTLADTGPRVPPAVPSSRDTEHLGKTVSAIEARIAARIGVAVRNLEGTQTFAWRGGERFPLCSTFKVLGCGAVLARVDRHHEDLQRRIFFGTSDVVSNSPITQARTGPGGMDLAELCEAAITRSDNTAGNLILASLGGPSGVTSFARSLGDEVTRLDRTETALNEALPGDPRDTTTPDAMAADLAQLVLGTALSPGSRAQLEAWLLANKTGDARLRAGFPAGWRIGDKTGSGERGTTNDVAVVWPPGRAPLVVCVYLTDTSAPIDACNAAIASIGRAVATFVGP